MPIFDPPYPGNQRERNTEWRRDAHISICDVDFLWGLFWHRYNTIQIPIFGEEEYFQIAIAIARRTKNREEFEKEFEKTNKERREALRRLMGAATLKSMGEAGFPCKAAQDAAFFAGQTGCLEYFIKLLKGTVYGWEADIVGEEELDPADKESSASADGKRQSPAVGKPQSPANEKPQSPAIEIPRTLGDDMPSPIDDYDHARSLQLQLELPDDCHTQDFDSWDLDYYAPGQLEAELEAQAGAVFYIGTVYQYAAPTPASTNGLEPASEQKSSLPLPSCASISEKGREEKRTQDVLDEQLVPDDENSTPKSRKRVRFNDDDDHINNHGHKRRKLEAPVSPSIQQVSSESLARKRPRSRDENDENEDAGRKRQKTESSASTSASAPASSTSSPPSTSAPSSISTSVSPSSPSSSSFSSSISASSASTTSPLPTSPSLAVVTENTSANELPQEGADSAGKKRAANTSNSRRQPPPKRKTISRTPRTRQTRPPPSISSTRSSRRSKSSALWELDSSGKPRQF
ncbi:hypothetical protein TARUN_570 [Trichoderma arundinaceum]|uniref:Uncharacterized protein n=1 Tax=Trichoderma arundinaceum TaxID=490622 RepID=A0A395NZW4_TRIAR|nr:hypothetical protein TARUN_570 [Trichoderma arundinaceum]